MKNTILSLLLFISIHPVSSIAQQAETEMAFANYHHYFADGQKVKDAEKEKFIQDYRIYYSKNGIRRDRLSGVKLNGQECLDLLNEDGQFTDFLPQEQEIMDKKLLNTSYFATENPVANFLTDAYKRLSKIADDYRTGKLSTSDKQYALFLKSIVHYGAIEIGRPNNVPRFHASCFALPQSASEIYFCLLKQMDEVEAGKSKDQQLIAAVDMLKAIALQSWTQPLRKDETDKNVVQIERFRNHVWWVGGNALAYRPLLPVAFMYKSIPMVDLLADVCQKCMSTTSQSTYKSAFWTEGFTADGAAWGHGMQSLIWGYPIDGTSSALKMLNILKGSPWAKNISRENVAALLNFFHGSNWYYYKGYTISGINRTDMKYDLTPKPIRYDGMVKTLLGDWKDSFTPDELSELKQLSKEAGTNAINMMGQKEGVYTGTRWFYNNDDLMKKNANYHIMVNMASVRCDGLESALNVADEYNFFTDDGATLFQKNGNEYRQVFGAWDVTATPGVTARQGMDKLTPVTNWRGYCSKFNFAGAATLGGENAVGGFVFEKMNGSDKGNVNDKGTSMAKNESLYGVNAHKSYFMLGDYFVALGAGITNLQPEMEGTIRTTMDQTAKEGEVVVIKNGKEEMVTAGKQSFVVAGKPVWVAQKNKFAYTILPEFTTNAFFICENKKTDWVKMNNENKKVANLPKTANLLTLWVDHGQKVVNGTYGYVVFAGEKLPAKELPFQVLRNDTLVQAVQSIDQKVTEVVFYSSNTKLESKGISLLASAPCVVLIENRGAEYVLSVTDPQMNADLEQIKLTLGKQEITVEMPQGEFCGKPTSLIVKR